METFNSYENSWTVDKVFIKLNDETYLYVGDFELILDDSDDSKQHSYDNEWNPTDKIKIKKVKSNEGDFKRVEAFDGYEFTVPDKYKRVLLKYTLAGNDE